MIQNAPLKKTRTYRVTILNGFGQKIFHEAGQSAKALEREILALLTSEQKLGSIEYVGFYPVSSEPDDDSQAGVRFFVEGPNEVFPVVQGQPGFDHLLSLDAQGVTAVDRFNANYNE